MSPKPGTPVSLVAPAAPTAPKEADKTDAGAVDAASGQAKSPTSGSTASTKVGEGPAGAGGGGGDAAAPAHEPDKTKKGWIEVLLKDEEGTAQGGVRYRVTLPDGSIAEGTLDAKGGARVDGFDSGSCKVTFPDLDEKTWNEK